MSSVLVLADLVDIAAVRAWLDVHGQLVEEVARTARAAQQFRALGLALAHRAEPEQARKPSPLVPILKKLGLPVLARRLRPFSTA